MQSQPLNEKRKNALQRCLQLLAGKRLLARLFSVVNLGFDGQKRPPKPLQTVCIALPKIDNINRLNLLVVSFALWGCQGPQQSDKESSTDTLQVDSSKIIQPKSKETDSVKAVQEPKETSDESTTQPLGLKTIKDFELNGRKRATKINDSRFAEFLKAFTIYQNSANDSLFHHPDYDLWNTLVYSPDDVVSSEALHFRDSVREIGFVVAASEGSIYLDKDPNFLIRFSPYLSKRMNSFLTEYNEDIWHPFTEDNSIMVSTEEHIRRIVFWENFSKENPDFELPDYASRTFRFLLFRFMMGTGNSAIHDWGNPPRVRPEVIESFQRVIDDNPSSTSAKYLNDYLNFLEKKNFIWDRTFNEYGREKFPEMYGN